MIAGACVDSLIEFAARTHLVVVHLVLWVVAGAVVLARGTASKDAPSNRGRDAVMIEFGALGFLMLGVGLILCSRRFWIAECAFAGLTMVLAYFVLNIWAMVCAIVSGARREFCGPALGALLASLLAPIPAFAGFVVFITD